MGNFIRIAFSLLRLNGARAGGRQSWSVRRPVWQFFTVQGDLLRRLQTHQPAVADWIGRSVKFRIVKRIGVQGHVAALFKENGLAPHFILRSCYSRRADWGVDVVALNARVVDADEFDRWAACAGEGVAGDLEMFDGRDAVLAEGVVRSRIDRRVMRAQIDIDKSIFSDRDAAWNAADKPHTGVE